MYVGVIHTVKDRAAWDQMVQGTPQFPEGFELVSTGTSEDAARAICLWRAPSVEALQSMLDQALGELAVNDCFGVPDKYAYVANEQETASA